MSEIPDPSEVETMARIIGSKEPFFDDSDKDILLFWGIIFGIVMLAIILFGVSDPGGWAIWRLFVGLFIPVGLVSLFVSLWINDEV